MNGICFTPHDSVLTQSDHVFSTFALFLGQDYVNIYGLKIWQEEVSRIVNYNVEQECNSFLRQKVHDWQSVYQSKDIPIPRFPPVDGSVNFIGRLAREVLRQTAPATTTYIEQKHAWYDDRTQQEIMQSGMFSSMHSAVGTFGLSGLDRLLSFMAVKELQTFQQTHLRVVQADKAMLAFHGELSNSIRPVTGVPSSIKVHESLSDYHCTFLPAYRLVYLCSHCFLVSGILGRNSKGSAFVGTSCRPGIESWPNPVDSTTDRPGTELCGKVRRKNPSWCIGNIQQSCFG